jgi:hypothetical protein
MCSLHFDSLNFLCPKRLDGNVLQTFRSEMVAADFAKITIADGWVLVAGFSNILRP